SRSRCPVPTSHTHIRWFHKLCDTSIDPLPLKRSFVEFPKWGKVSTLARVLTFHSDIPESLSHTARYSPLGCHASNGTAIFPNGNSTSTSPVSALITWTLSIPQTAMRLAPM